MSYLNFQKAKELAKQCNDYYTGKSKTTEEIIKSEEMLGMKFSKQLLDYYSGIGYLSFLGIEIYRIYPNSKSGTMAGNSIASALHDREKYNLSSKWLPIYFFDDGYMGYLDYSQINEEGEPPVIMAVYDGSEYVVVEKVAEDFGDFLPLLVEEQLSER